MAPKKKKSIEELLDQPSRTVEDNRNLITQINQDVAKSKRGKWCKKHMPKAWPEDKHDLFIDPKNGPNKPNETILGEMVAIWINVYKLSKNEELLETTNVETMRNMILKEMEDTDTVKELYKFIREKSTPAAVMVPVDIKEFNSEVPGNPGPGSGLNIVSPLIGVEVAVDKFQRADAAPRSSFVHLHEVSQKNKFIEGCGNQNSEDHTTQLCAKSSLEDVHEVSPEFTSDILKESTPIEGCHNQNDDDHTPVEPAEKNKFIEGCGNQNSEDHTTQLCAKIESKNWKDIQAPVPKGIEEFSSGVPGYPGPGNALNIEPLPEEDNLPKTAAGLIHYTNALPQLSLSDVTEVEQSILPEHSEDHPSQANAETEKGTRIMDSEESEKQLLREFSPESVTQGDFDRKNSENKEYSKINSDLTKCIEEGKAWLLKSKKKEDWIDRNINVNITEEELDLRIFEKTDDAPTDASTPTVTVLSPRHQVDKKYFKTSKQQQGKRKHSSEGNDTDTELRKRRATVQ